MQSGESGDPGIAEEDKNNEPPTTMESPRYQAPKQEEIAAFAHSIWEQEGRPEGRGLCHWFQAEAHLIAARKMDAGLVRRPRSKGGKPASGIKSKRSGGAAGLPVEWLRVLRPALGEQP